MDEVAAINGKQIQQYGKRWQMAKAFYNNMLIEASQLRFITSDVTDAAMQRFQSLAIMAQHDER